MVDRHIRCSIDWDDELGDIRILGIDEISLRKGGKRFVTIISAKTSTEELKIITVIEGRDEEAVSSFLITIPEEVKVKIETVCIDMSHAYRNAAEKELPHAKIVADRFHVAKAYRKRFDKLRKKELARLKEELPEEDQEQIKGTMWALRKNGDSLDETEEESLAGIFQYSEALGEAYRLREDLTKIFDSDINRNEAKEQIDKWKKDVRESGLGCYDSFLTTLDTWEPYILNYFDERLSSGFVEGANNKAKVLKRRCYGIKSALNFFKRFALDVNLAPKLLPCRS
jgi:transposase